MGFPTKNDHFWGVLGVPPFKETPIYLDPLFQEYQAQEHWFETRRDLYGASVPTFRTAGGEE